MAQYDIHIMESLQWVWGNRGNDIYSRGTGNKCQFLVEQGTKAIFGNMEHKKNNFRFLGNREISIFISGEQGNGYPARRVS